MHKAADLMNPGERRALTSGEIAIGQTVFGDEIDWARVRVHQTSPLGFGAMVPIGKTIVFSKWRAARDFSKASLDEQGWFVHELTHVWQAACGCVLAGAKLGALGKNAYTYKHRSNAHLYSYNIERQAEIVRHLFLSRAGVRDAKTPPLDWLEGIWSKRRKTWP
jgi:hypothetical protein